MDSYIKLGIATLLPVLAAVLLYLLNTKTFFGKTGKAVKQIVCGVIFGALAIIGTEWGIPMNGAQVNCRDAAVLVAGLMFGGPAGIIAGVIGAAERWIAVAWGIGTYTRVACTISTLLAGFFAAALRKYMFEGKKPGWAMSFAIGVVMEVFHLTMVFITNMDTPDKALAVIQSCSIPMVTANGVSVLLAAIMISVLAKKPDQDKTEKKARIAQTIQRWLLLTVSFAFIITSIFVFKLQNEIAESQAKSLIKLEMDYSASEIDKISDKKMLDITKEIAAKAETESLSDIAKEYGLAEISVFDENSVVSDSSDAKNIGLNAADYEETWEFVELLGNRSGYVQDYRGNVVDNTQIRKYAGVKTDTGFLQTGFDAHSFQHYTNFDVIGVVQSRHVGETGYMLVANSQKTLLSTPEGMQYSPVAEGIGKLLSAEPDTMVKAVVNGEEVFYSYRVVEEYYVISVLPAAEALKIRDVALYVNMYLEILVFAVLFGMIYMLIKKVVVNQIEDINKSLTKITGGDLDEVVNVRSNQEFASLSDDINATVDTLKRYIAEASARIDAELEFAKDIQRSALPNIFPAFPKRKDFDVYATMTPAKEVGGDFYDFYLTDNSTLNILVADVSGKGIPAAMFMMRAKTELKTLTEAETPLCDVFTLGNKALCEGNDAGMFVTAWQGSINLESGLLQYANAGHNPPLVRHADGKFEYLRSRAGFVLAGMDTVKFKTQQLQLVPGDIVYLYTDGVTEAANSENELFGEARLLEAVNSVEPESMEQLCRLVKSKVDEFVGGAPQFDDITMLAFRFIGEPPAPSVHYDEADIQDIASVTEFVETQLEKLDFPMKSTMQISVAIDEIFSNIVRYAYPGKKGPVTVTFIAKEDPNAVYIRFEDKGVPYNPLTNKDPDVTLSAEERSIGGLGIFMVKKTMDEVKYKYENECNILTIKKLY